MTDSVPKEERTLQQLYAEEVYEPASESVHPVGMREMVYRVRDVDPKLQRLTLDLERYKHALYAANGFLIQLGKDPVKLDYEVKP